jgi:pyridoxal biosynthesis lyase PdxS
VVAGEGGEIFNREVKQIMAHIALLGSIRVLKVAAGGTASPPDAL